MVFVCEACHKEHSSWSSLCPECREFLDRFQGLVAEFTDPIPALRQYCSDELNWIVFDGDDDFDLDCLARMRRLHDEGVRP